MTVAILTQFKLEEGIFWEDKMETEDTGTGDDDSTDGSDSGGTTDRF